MSIDPDVEVQLQEIRARLAAQEAAIETLDGRVSAVETPPSVPDPVPPNPLVDERFAAATGTGHGLTSHEPLRLDDGFRWLDEQTRSAYLRIVDPKVDAKGAVYKFKNTGPIGGWRTVTSHTDETEFAYSGPGYLQSMFDVSGCQRIAFRGLSSNGQARQSALLGAPSGCMYFVTATSAPTPNHHIWVDGGTHQHLDGVVSVYNDHKHSAPIGDYYCVENIDAVDIAHWGPWGGSGISVLAPVEAKTPDVDPQFEEFGQIWRNNTFRDVYQKVGNNNRITDGNAMILDFWNESDFWGAAGKSDYDRACLIEGNITAGCGRALSGVYANPKGGIWHRFNTHFHDGSTSEHALPGHHSIDVVPCTLGGFGMYTTNFHSVANVVVLKDGRHVTGGQTFDMGNYGADWKELHVSVSGRSDPRQADLGVLANQIKGWVPRDGVVDSPWVSGQPVRDRLLSFAAPAFTQAALRTGPDMTGSSSQRVGALA